MESWWRCNDVSRILRKRRMIRGLQHARNLHSSNQKAGSIVRRFYLSVFRFHVYATNCFWSRSEMEFCLRMFSNQREKLCISRIGPLSRGGRGNCRFCFYETCPKSLSKSNSTVISNERRTWRKIEFSGVRTYRTKMFVRRYSFGRRNFNEIALRDKSILMNLSIQSFFWWMLILRPRIRANNQDIRIRYHLCKGLYRLSNDPAYAYNGLLWAVDRPAIHNNMLLPRTDDFLLYAFSVIRQRPRCKLGILCSVLLSWSFCKLQAGVSENIFSIK